MENLNDIVKELVADIEISDDVPVMYEVWAVGCDEYDVVTASEMFVTCFTDPDEAVAYAESITAEEIINFAAESHVGSDVYSNIEAIIIEVETVVLDENNDSVNVGTVYKKTLAVSEELAEFVTLTNSDYEVIEETGNIQIPCTLLREYNKNDTINILFTDEEQPVPIAFKIISRTTSGHYICEFV
jgi:hypothetical protein